VSVHNNDFESFICKKASRESIEVSGGRNSQNMSTDCVCSIDCGFSVLSHSLALKYAMHSLVSLNLFVEYHVGVF
jgi:hypothetical protein